MESQDAPIRRIIGTLISYALREQAHEIRVKPLASGLVVHYRVQDEWREQMKIPSYVKSPLTQELIDLANVQGESPENPRHGTYELELKEDLLSVTYTIPIEVSLYPEEYGQRIHLKFQHRSS